MASGEHARGPGREDFSLLIYGQITPYFGLIDSITINCLRFFVFFMFKKCRLGSDVSYKRIHLAKGQHVL